MRCVELRNSDGDTVGFDFPERPEEVSAKQKINFETHYRHLLSWMNTELEAGTFVENRIFYLYMVAKVLCEFLEISLDSILKLDSTDLLDRHGNLSMDILQEHMKSLETQNLTLDLDSLEDSLLTLYGNVHAVVKEYKPRLRTGNNLEIEYYDDDPENVDENGDRNKCTWILPHTIKQAYTGKQIYSKLNTAQAVELLEVKRKVNLERTALDESGSDYDPNGDLDLKETLYAIALLIRKKLPDGTIETMPLEPSELSLWLEHRAHHFEEIDMCTACDIGFFLLNII